MTPYYDHAGITIYHGDSRAISIGGADLLLTDPPYELTAAGGGIGAQRGYLAEIDGRMDGGFDYQILDRFPNWFCFCSKKQLPRLLGVAESQPGRWMLITWNKPNPTPLSNGNYLPDTEYIVHHFANSRALHGQYAERSRFIFHPGGGGEGHPAAKPLPVVSRLVLNGSKEGQTILDPYMGIGSTLIAAKLLGRRAIGIEIEERYCEIAARRLAQEILPLTADPAPNSVQRGIR